MKNNFADQRTNERLLKFYQSCLNNSVTIQNLFTADQNRHKNFTTEDLNCHLDFSKNWIDNDCLDLLYNLADNKLTEKIDCLFNGGKLNSTEQRAALHTALREVKSLYSSNNISTINLDYINVNEVYDAIQTTQFQIQDLEKKLNNKELRGFSNKPINTIVNIGIGGSDLGPKMVYNALQAYWSKNITCHFVSNIDPADINAVLEQADPQTTLFIVSSKSFTTAETLANANSARKWMLQYCNESDIVKHFVAITSDIKKAHAFGIAPNNIFPMWDWVGGRYSVWSAIGLTIALGTSYEIYLDLLKGAQNLDQHFKTKSWSENMPVLLGLLGIGYINYADCISHAILPYAKNLEYFPNYIQQLDMESNGKSVDISNYNISYRTAPIVWGAAGTNGQHAFYQLLHQGNHVVPCDFIVPLAGNSYANPEQERQQQALIANAFAQSKTLMDGYNQTKVPKYKLLPGNKPSNTLLLPKLTPYYLGVLIALYEHKVFVQGVIWNINSFDQWGIERGKVIAEDILQKLYYNKQNTDYNDNLDSSTLNLIKQYQKIREIS